MKIKSILLIAGIVICSVTQFTGYPYDGYLTTGIRRLLRLELVHQGIIKDTPLLPGAQKSTEEIQLNLYRSEKGDNLLGLPAVDQVLQKELSGLFPNLHESYSIALLDITPGRSVRYAQKQPTRGFQPGSIGKLAVIAALLTELERIYPSSFTKRQELLKSRFVRGGRWAVYDEHTVPFFDPETKTLVKRQVKESDIFSLFEWADHMLSVSNNGAASVVWREAILMRVFGTDYPKITEEQGEDYFTNTPKSELAEIAITVVNDPLRAIGITHDEWRLGTMFTRGATGYIPGKGGSIGTPSGLMKFLIAIERGVVVDPESSLEIKRLMYMTDRRIRYAANERLKGSAVYFKSGSLYKCKPEEGYTCAKYMGNELNYMNSVAIIERPDGAVYLVALMSNVLKKNSNIDHNVLAGRIDRLIASAAS